MTGGVVGIAVSGAGTSGTVLLAYQGISPCVFDNASTAGDYVGISTSVAGDCTDTGVASNPSTSPPSTGQIIGIVLVTNGSAGTNNVRISIQPAAIGLSNWYWCNTPGTCSTTWTYVAGMSVVQVDLWGGGGGGGGGGTAVSGAAVTGGPGVVGEKPLTSYAERATSVQVRQSLLATVVLAERVHPVPLPLRVPLV